MKLNVWRGSVVIAALGLAIGVVGGLVACGRGAVTVHSNSVVGAASSIGPIANPATVPGNVCVTSNYVPGDGWAYGVVLNPALCVPGTTGTLVEAWAADPGGVVQCENATVRVYNSHNGASDVWCADVNVKPSS